MKPNRPATPRPDRSDKAAKPEPEPAAKRVPKPAGRIPRDLYAELEARRRAHIAGGLSPADPWGGVVPGSPEDVERRKRLN